MTAPNRRSSFSSSTMSSIAKKNSSSSSEKLRKENATKRAPLSNITNRQAPLSIITNQKSGLRSSVSSCNLVSCSNKTGLAKKTAPNASPHADSCSSSRVLPARLNSKPSTVVSSKARSLPKRDETVSIIPTLSAPSYPSMDVSPSKSDLVSVSLDESMSTCDSFKSPQVEYIDNDDVSESDSVERKAFSSLCILENAEPKNISRRDIVTDDKIANLDNNFDDPQFCATFASDIYKHLRESEAKKRPSTDFMERIQKDVNASMRGILIDWLVEVSEEYRLVPETMYLTVNYIDRYLSGNMINRQRLQLLGVACMMIAAKYEEICAPQVEEFCYITDNTYFKEEVLEMESSVLNYLKFEMTVPTAKCFLRRFVRAAQGINEVPSMHLECMTNYLTELSLLEYSMLRYAPSLIAASAIFLANFILDPSNKPWNSTLEHYTLYRPRDLTECVKDLHRLCCTSHTSSLPAIRDKYSQHKYKSVAKKHCPPLIPSEFFFNLQQRQTSVQHRSSDLLDNLKF